MRNLVVLFIHLITTLAPLLGPGGVRSLVAESLILKHQLLIANRSRLRSNNLPSSDRILAGLLALLVRPTRLLRSAIVLKPSTLLAFHKTMSKQKYRMLFSPNRRRMPARPWRSTSTGFSPITTGRDRTPMVPPGCFLGHMKDSLWNMDLFRCESATLRSHWVLVVMDQYTRRIIKTYFNNHRTHTSLKGRTPDTTVSRPVANLGSFRWQPQCRAPCQTPVAA